MRSLPKEDGQLRGAVRLMRVASLALGAAVLAALTFQLCLMHFGRDQGFGPSMAAPRILEALALLSMVGAFALLFGRLLGSRMAGLGAGVGAGVLTLFCHVNLGFWDTAQPESFGGVLVVWALVLASAALSAPARRPQLREHLAWAGCAALFTLAAILKPPLGGGILFAFPVLILHSWRAAPPSARIRRTGRLALAFLSGSVLVAGLHLLYLVAKGAWADFHYVFFEYLPHYTAIPSLWIQVFASWPAAAHPFLWVGILLALLPPRLHEREAQTVLLVVGAVLVQIVGVALQAKFFPYHYGGLVPLVALLTVWGYAKLWRVWHRRHRRPGRDSRRSRPSRKTAEAGHGGRGRPGGGMRWVPIAGMILVLLLAGHYASTQKTLFHQSRLRWEAWRSPERADEINDRLYSIYDVNAHFNRLVAEWIEQNTPADLPIHVWGFEPTLYTLSNRRPASRYIYNVPQRSAWGQEQARAILIEELHAAQPAVIVVVKRDGMPHVVGNDLDSEQALATYPALLRLLHDRYRIVGIAQDLSVYMRSDLADALQNAGDSIPAEHRHVLLITIDTLRADYLSSQGFPLPTTPALDSLYTRATVFTRALTPIPRTTQALASLLTGRYPHGTGVRRLLDRLSPQAPSLAEMAHRQGYATVAVVSNHLLTIQRGLDRGFDVYDFADDTRSAQQTTDAVKQALSSMARDDAIFLWVHYIDPHVPYYPERETIGAFAPNYAGPYRHHFGQVYGGTGNRAYPADLPKRIAVYQNELPEDVNAHIRTLYAADIRDTDNALADLLAWLKTRFGDDWTICVTADHGESLGEHDFYFDHGDYVYNASTRIPLALALPHSAPAHGHRIVEDWVSLIDLAPTLIELLGWTVPPDVTARFDGRSLMPHLRGEELPSRALFAECGQSYFPELIRGRVRFDIAGRFRAVWKDEWKLIWTPFQEGAREHQLYNMTADPHECTDLSAEHPEVVAALSALLRAWHVTPGVAESREQPSEKDLERLRSLGYIGN